jgi:hypothetical protein
MALGTISADNAGDLLIRGYYTDTGLTAGSPYYISATAGAKTATAPSTSGQIVRIVGYAISATSFFFDPDHTYIEVN